MDRLISITPIPAFQDNYLWLLDNGIDAVVVDPGDARPVIEYLQANKLNLHTILVTHHHADHIGGVKQLKQLTGCRVVGPANESIPLLDLRCQQGDQVKITPLDITFNVLDLPGHTAGHIAYFAAAGGNSKNILFCGDTIFSAGCGRLFEGTAAQMWHSISKIMALPDDTLIFPAHEYTLSNLNFARQVEPDNLQLQAYWRQVNEIRQQGRPSLPATLGIEKQINPFMRVEVAQVVSAANHHSSRKAQSAEEVFAAIRHWKDIF